jgi:hypothetical protein
MKRAKCICHESTDVGTWREILLKVYIYTLFLLMIYALFVGFKMSHMLSEGKEIGDFLKSTHVHILMDSFLMLFISYDLRLKRLEKLKVSCGEEIIGAGVLGVVLAAFGFSIAALIPAMAEKGIEIFGIGQTLLFFSFFFYVISAVIAEVYK